MFAKFYKHIIRIITISLACSLYLAQTATANAQDIDLFSPSAAVITYDPFTGLPGLETLSLDLRNTGPMARDVTLIVTPDLEADFRLNRPGSSALLFELASPQGQASNQLYQANSTLPESQSTIIDILLKVPAGQYADAGDANTDLKITVVDSVTQEPLISEKIVQITARTPLRAQTNFAGTSSGFENGTSFSVVDFGEIQGGDSRTVNFQIRGNSDVDISMESENRGRLINLTAPDASAIPYQVTADGLHSSLASPLNFSRRPEKTLAGSSYPLTITLDDMAGGVYAGQYRDIISIDVTPR